MSMVTVDQALETILAKIKFKGVEKIPIGESLGRTLTEDIIARRNNPPLDNSAMDGYALLHDDPVLDDRGTPEPQRGQHRPGRPIPAPGAQNDPDSTVLRRSDGAPDRRSQGSAAVERGAVGVQRQQSVAHGLLLPGRGESRGGGGEGCEEGGNRQVSERPPGWVARHRSQSPRK